MMSTQGGVTPKADDSTDKLREFDSDRGGCTKTPKVFGSHVYMTPKPSINPLPALSEWWLPCQTNPSSLVDGFLIRKMGQIYLAVNKVYKVLWLKYVSRTRPYEFSSKNGKFSSAIRGSA